MTSISADERQALAAAVREAAETGPRDFLSEDGSLQRDERLWKVLTDQIGLGGLLADESAGGAGAGIAEVAVVLQELASALAVVPGLSSLAMAPLSLRVAGSDPASGLLERLASDVTATVAWPTRWYAHPVPTVGQDGDGWTGRCEVVIDGASADVLLVPVRLDSLVGLVAIEGDAEGVTRTPLVGLDLTRELVMIDLTRAPGLVLSESFDAAAAFDLTLVACAAEQVGIAQRCHDAAVAWAKERVQFDRPIGQFQAIKHLLVDLLMDVELSRSALDVAIDAAQKYLDGPSRESADSLRVAARFAASRAGDAATHVADESLHVHGGIGFTWEHDAHLYYRRARSLEIIHGDPASHRLDMARALLGVTDV